MPNIADHIQDAQSRGYPSILTRTTDRDRIRRNRREACGNFKGPDSCDEYPFASTYEGGRGASVRGVPVSEQFIQGGVISAFYNLNGIPDGGQFRVIT